MKQILLLVLSLLISTFSIILWSAETPQDETYKLGKNAYIYAYPLVLMGVTEEVMTNARTSHNGHAPVNQFANVSKFPSPDYRDVVHPSVDTLYSNAWLNLSKGPIVLSVPDSDDRYYLLPLIDAWTDVFSSVGKRTTGTKKGDFVIVGPTWRGDLPAGLTRIAAPTNTVWIIGRTETKGVNDYTNVNEFQKNLRLTPLSAWGKKNYIPPNHKVNPKIDMKTSPPQQVAKMDAVTFFKKFAELLKVNPPHKSDGRIIGELAQIGIVPGQDFNPANLTKHQLDMLNKAVKDAKAQIESAHSIGGERQNGWNITRKNIGNYGNDYLARAIVARFGLGANIPDDAIYPFTTVDVEGKPLNGKNKYVLHFERDQVPPVKGFWSLTLYDPEGYFTSNAINRFAIGDKDKLDYNPDGSLDIYIQNERPRADKVSNWLPAPSGEFNLLLRFYWPKSPIIHGSWAIPGVQVVKTTESDSSS